jgi:hypothetical protein
VDDTTAFEDAVDDGFGEIVVVQDGPPGGPRPVGGEDHGALALVALVDDVEEDVGGIGPVGQVAHLGDDEQLRVRVAAEGGGEAAVARCAGR